MCSTTIRSSRSTSRRWRCWKLPGSRIFHDEAVELFREGGAVVSDGNLVRLPISLVERALGHNPRAIHLAGRDGGRAIRLQKDEANFGTGSDLPFTYDRKTGERRRTNYQDVSDAARIVDYLPNIDFHMSHGLSATLPTRPHTTVTSSWP